MITAINNNYSTRTQLRTTQNKNNNIQSKQNSTSPNFKGGGADFAAYFAADFTAIIAACGIVDYYFKKVAANQVKRFSAMATKRLNNKPEFEKISQSAGHVVDSLKQNPKTQKLGTKLQKSFEKIFQSPLEFDKSKEKPKGTTSEHLEALSEQVKDFFLTADHMDRQSGFSTIGEPFIESIEKTQAALAKTKLSQQSYSRKGALSNTLNSLGTKLQPPNVPKSQHP